MRITMICKHQVVFTKIYLFIRVQQDHLKKHHRRLANKTFLLRDFHISVYSPKIHELLSKLIHIFKLLRNNNVKNQPDKFKFLCMEIAYFHQRRYLTPSKKCPKDMKSFLEFANGLSPILQRYVSLLQRSFKRATNKS